MPNINTVDVTQYLDYLGKPRICNCYATIQAGKLHSDDTGFLGRHIRNTGKVLTTCRHFRTNGQPLEKKRTKQGYLYKVPKLTIPTYGNPI